MIQSPSTRGGTLLKWFTWGSIHHRSCLQLNVETVDMSLHDPRWILIAWGVVAVASAVRFWKLTGPFRARLQRQHRLAEMSPDQVRDSLERSWRKSNAKYP